MNELKLLIPIKNLPVGMRVTKRTGDKLYIVQDEVSARVFADKRCGMKPVVSTIIAESGCRFLVGHNNDATAVPDDLIVAAVFENEDTLLDWLETRKLLREDK